MNLHNHDPKLVSLSLSIYRLLLYVYPSGFRREYGPHMTQVFRDCCLRAIRNDGTPGMLSLWATVCLDLVQSVLSEHIRKGVHMSKQRFVQLSSWCLIFGGIALVLGFGADWLSSAPEYDPYNFYSRPIDRVLETINLVSLPASMVLITIGVAGLYARYTPDGGKTAKLFLGLSVSGGLVASIAVLPLLLTDTDGWWSVMMLGFVALFLGLLLFGLVAVRSRLMRRGNWLPVAAGLFITAFLLVSTIYEINTGGWLELTPMVDVIGMLVTGLSLVGIGYVMLSDLPEEQMLSPA